MAFLLAVIIIILGVSAVPISKQARPLKAPEKKAALLNYTWYYDEDFTYSVGVIPSDAPTEVARLRGMYGLNTFTTTWSMNLHGYEWGYYIDEQPVIIYSDL